MPRCFPHSTCPFVPRPPRFLQFVDGAHDAMEAQEIEEAEAGGLTLEKIGTRGQEENREKAVRPLRD